MTHFVKQNSTCTINEAQDPRFDSPVNLVSCTYWLPPFSPGQNYTYIDDDRNVIDNSSVVLSWTLAYENERSHKPLFVVNAPWIFTKVLQGEDSTLPGEVHLSNGKIIPSSLFAIALIKTAPLIGSASTGFVNTAHICSLSVCAMEYNVSMISGVPQTEIISTSYSRFMKNGDWDGRFSGNYSYKFTFPNEINNFIVESNRTATSDDQSYTFEDRLYRVLRQVLQGTLTFNYDEYQSDLDYGTTMNIIQNGFNASTNIPKTMDRVAAAMTNRLRDISNLTVQGQSGSMQLHIRVSWWWLVLPTLTVIFETILLISIMVITRRHKLPIWKTSELALLFHGIDLSTLTGGQGRRGDDHSAEMLRASEMEDVASALHVRFGRDSEKNVVKLERKLK